MKTIALVFAALAAGCATGPEQPFGTTGTNPDQLALVSVAGSEVKILESDGKPFPGSGTSDFLIQPRSLSDFGLNAVGCPNFQQFSRAARAYCSSEFAFEYQYRLVARRDRSSPTGS